MRIFEQYPKGTPCLVCGKDDPGQCVLIALDGTQEGNSEQALVAHLDCLMLRCFAQKDVIYQRLNP